MEQDIRDLIGSPLFRMVLLRWLDILGVVLWVGAIGFRRLIFVPSLKVVEDPAEKEKLVQDEARYTEGALGGLLVYLLLVHLLTWVQQAQLTSGAPILRIGTALPGVLFGTSFGRIWFIKLFLLGLLFSITRARIETRESLLFGIGLSLCLAGTLSSHAVSRGLLYSAGLADWIHYTAVSIWAGGLFPLARIARKAALCLSLPTLTLFLTRSVALFSRWATLCVMLILITGGYNAFLLSGKGPLLDFLYGRVLVTKLIFVALAFGLGGFSQFFILPALIDMKVSPDEAALSVLRKRFLYAITAEIGVVLAVLGWAALLTRTVPPLFR